MLGSHEYYQVIKIGVFLFKNHFNDAFHDTEYVKVISPFMECDLLKRTGIFEYTNKKGEKQEFSKYVVSVMPPSIKKKYFPDRPDLITGKGDVSELDFRSQFELEWLDDVSNFLTEEQQKRLSNGHYKLQISPSPNGVYVFGLDTSSGRPDMTTLGLDWTVLTIWELVAGKFLRVYSHRWQGDPLIQYDEILGCLKKFKVKYGIMDFSSLAYMMVTMLQRDGIKVEGIQYQATCSSSHKDWKTTIFENFESRLNLNQLEYPSMNIDDYREYWSLDEKKNIVWNNVEMENCFEDLKEDFFQWTILQRVKSKGSNKLLINAPSGHNDDFANSNCLAVWASNNANVTLANAFGGSIPVFVSKGAAIFGR
jgi:hypothetical protein